MNEKIKEFLAAKRCQMDDMCFGEPTHDEWYELDDIEIKEFIGLIVQDVLNVVYDEIQYNFGFGVAKSRIEEITDGIAKQYIIEK